MAVAKRSQARDKGSRLWRVLEIRLAQSFQQRAQESLRELLSAYDSAFRHVAHSFGSAGLPVEQQPAELAYAYRHGYCVLRRLAQSQALSLSGEQQLQALEQDVLFCRAALAFIEECAIVPGQADVTGLLVSPVRMLVDSLRRQGVAGLAAPARARRSPAARRPRRETDAGQQGGAEGGEGHASGAHNSTGIV